jgi:tellurite resistance protein TehA-like permease
MLSLGLAFYIILFVWLIFRVWRAWPNPAAVGDDAIIFVLLLLLGWHSFGPPLGGH